jgi:uncharacterized protein YacL
MVIRAVFTLILVGAGYFIQPLPSSFAASLGLSSALLSAVIALVLAVGIIFFELRIRQASLKTLIGAAIGSTLGIIGASLIGFLLTAQKWDHPIQSFVTVALTMFMAYVGLMVGAAKGDYLDLGALGGILSDRSTVKMTYKILDTSVIIDGRVADIAETGFLSGTILIPQFVLRELQQIADSSDSAKRNRGRRGLDILQRIQKNGNLDVQVWEGDFPNVREVDLKLIELGKQLNAPIVTNDFNLANTLKPVVLPGEAMRVFVLKEGKEYNQGVAYLDDGTMVVVDNARRLIGKNVDLIVTSVLQTTAGKMIFGRAEENQKPEPREQQRDYPREARDYRPPRAHPVES